MYAYLNEAERTKWGVKHRACTHTRGNKHVISTCVCGLARGFGVVRGGQPLVLRAVLSLFLFFDLFFLWLFFRHRAGTGVGSGNKRAEEGRGSQRLKTI